VAIAFGDKGYFIEPTFCLRADNMNIAPEELVGPVMAF